MTPITTDMKSFTYNSVSYVVVEVPKEAGEVILSKSNRLPINILIYGEGDYIDLPYGNYEILGEITRTKDGDIGFETNQLINGHEIIKAIQEQTAILFKNPMKEPDKLTFMATKFVTTIEYDKWESYEKQLLGKDKKLIVLKQKK